MPFIHTVKKGETLNQIANKYGFRNYKEAGISSVPSQDFNLIRPDEQISLGNYDPNKVQTSGEATPPVISSKDNAQEFAENKSKLESILAGKKETDEKDADIVEDTTDVDTTDKTKTDIDTEIIDDPLYTKSRADDKAKISEATFTMETDKEDYLSSITTRLSDIDAVTKSTIDRITLTANKRVKEQIRINTINTNRVKAYGLGGSGIYQPIQFSDAVTERERKGAEEVNELEVLRDQAISEAENASRLGKSDILQDKLDGLSDIEDRLRTKLSDIEKESNEQYKLLRTLRKEKEAERVKKVEETQALLKAFVSSHKDEYENLTPEEIEVKVSEVMRTSNLSYSEAYNAIIDGIQATAKDEKTEADIEYKKAQTEGVKARTAKTRKETEKLGEEEDDDYTTSQKQKLEQAGLGDADRQQKLDFLHDELYDEAVYVKNAEIGSIVVIGGNKYKKTADDDFEPVK